ncbi:hypothetical protein TVAG_409690 [Trichomonas vaginalis G3]|uniref:Uncharacterized protein n=1 Tax=Trichomonas vaginalis (strain ATCC PRA-98 / G3) TaxID=412133 RepID=A2F8C9_TRIV3|nr:glycine-rich protein family [Trichomonas vaginalis G3]EAX98831.1 hypothetical protein TVAG_409690 [Trichomonas vaginalis G3]KAI5532247.1 glycine-rich protein family [Trichomonas vaginalis G3]|eukprot:XP_001311761.1 hypothetical protein [Trichomonas vaginalis G3]
MYSILSDLETESYYKTKGKYEFLLHYPQLSGNNYNWWRQSLSPTIQTENRTKRNPDDHFVLGYEKVSVHYNGNNWGGLSLTGSGYGSYINGCINVWNWYFAIGCYGNETGFPGPIGGLNNYLKFVALYAKIHNLNMIRCFSCNEFRNSFSMYNFLLYSLVVV